ncbi:MAG: heme-binding protein, partial [Pseudomonadota bacterium]
MTAPTLPELEAEDPTLILPYFDEDMALRLGNAIVALAQARKAPVVVNIRNASRCFFHAALPGSSANNDNWARRKSNAALMTGHASLLIGMRHLAHNRTVEGEGWPLTDFS